MPAVSGAPFFFDSKSGNLAYDLSFIAQDVNNQFIFAIGNSGVDPDAGGIGTPAETTGIYSLSFSGLSGKLYDNDANYIDSYNGGAYTNVHGNIFSGYHNYFIDGVPVNLNCTRRTGDINALFVFNINQTEFNFRAYETVEPL